mmetsp:Transcript_49368/g.118939  ORF Transcript_49368/g.118939 Transcript_49368/m.118939 type:complete len:234 (+) Transcript_49368:110-811(+)
MLGPRRAQGSSRARYPVSSAAPQRCSSSSRKPTVRQCRAASSRLRRSMGCAIRLARRRARSATTARSGQASSACTSCLACSCLSPACCARNSSRGLRLGCAAARRRSTWTSGRRARLPSWSTATSARSERTSRTGRCGAAASSTRASASSASTSSPAWRGPPACPPLCTAPSRCFGRCCRARTARTRTRRRPAATTTTRQCTARTRSSQPSMRSASTWKRSRSRARATGGYQS